jgi:hypothetical protein
MRPYLNHYMGMVMCTCHPSYSRKCKIGGSQSKPAWDKAGLHLKTNHSKKGWRCGMSSRVPAEQAQSQYCKRKRGEGRGEEKRGRVEKRGEEKRGQKRRGEDRKGEEKRRTGRMVCLCLSRWGIGLTTTGFLVQELEACWARALKANLQVSADVRTATIVMQTFIHLWGGTQACEDSRAQKRWEQGRCGAQSGSRASGQWNSQEPGGLESLNLINQKTRKGEVQTRHTLGQSGTRTQVFGLPGQSFVQLPAWRQLGLP